MSRSITPKIIEILTKIFYTYGRNVVILAYKVAELSCGQAHDWWTQGRTHRQMDTNTHAGNNNTWKPKLTLGKNVKKVLF